MESKAILVISCMLIFLVGQGSSRIDKECYDQCMLQCLGVGGSEWICQYSCEASCRRPGTRSNVDLRCSLPCITSSCQQHLQRPESTKEGAEACVGSCFDKCP